MPDLAPDPVSAPLLACVVEKVGKCLADGHALLRCV
jgi:hypothetical protein